MEAGGAGGSRLENPAGCRGRARRREWRGGGDSSTRRKKGAPEGVPLGGPEDAADQALKVIGSALRGPGKQHAKLESMSSANASGQFRRGRDCNGIRPMLLGPAPVPGGFSIGPYPTLSISPLLRHVQAPAAGSQCEGTARKFCHRCPAGNRCRAVSGK